jgi:FtsP/CotA-like multicopper oxidase with cupredoxin domain
MLQFTSMASSECLEPTWLLLTFASQQGTPWSDGVPGVTQDAIKPGGSFVYRWTANDYGIYWYDSCC